MFAQAATIGRQHRLMNHNCQDFAVGGLIETGFAYGLVLDGCGSKYRESIEGGQLSKFCTYPSQNEVGARITGQFAARWLEKNLLGLESLECLPGKLQEATEIFLKAFLKNMGYSETAEIVRFIHTNLLTTLHGFAITPTEGCFFWAGDGFLCQNGMVTSLQYNNRPPYLAYNVVSENCDARFRIQIESCRFSLTGETTWLAVATDGWQAEQLAHLERPTSSLALQRLVNLEARQRGRFEDDGAIALWVRDDDTTANISDQ